MPITHQELIEILKYLEDSACEEFSLRTEGIDLKLRRRVAGSEPAQVSQPPPLTPRESEPPVSSPVEPAREAPAHSSESQDNGHMGTVSAPMAGTFYRRPAPDEPPFVEVGTQVSKGDALCTIEVMKLFSTVYADYAGRVADFEVEDGDPVEQGQTLLFIDAGNGTEG